MNRLILLVESRIRGDVYVRFGGELPKTHRSNTAGRWMLSLHPIDGKVEIPADAPPRPSDEAIWNVLSQKWVDTDGQHSGS